MSRKSTVLITGGSTGLGYAAALQLAKARTDLQIVVSSRSPTSDTLLSLPNVKWLKLDLSTHAATRAFVDTYRAESFPPISALVLNAGMQRFGQIYRTPDGLEEMVEINHLNQALLFFSLQDQLEPTARIIFVSSSTHDPSFKRAYPKYTTGDAAAHPTGDKYKSFQDGLNQYGLSKVCQVLFAYALHDHVVAARKQWTVITLDPGVMPTQLYRWATGITGVLFNWYLGSWIARQLSKDFFSTEFTAEALVKLIVDPEFGGPEKSGKYYIVRGVAEHKSSEQSYDKALQKDCWDWSVKELGVEAAAQLGTV